jgi:hypothetical protein
MMHVENVHQVQEKQAIQDGESDFSHGDSLLSLSIYLVNASCQTRALFDGFEFTGYSVFVKPVYP